MSDSYVITWKGFSIDTNYHNVYNPALPGAQIDTSNWTVLGKPINDFKAEPPTSNGGGFWFPQNVTVNADNDLQLQMLQNGPYYYDNTGAKQTVWTSAEAVFSDTLSYGVYCVVAEVTSTTGSEDPWPSFLADFNTVFGMFTYQTAADSEKNPHHELDITEVGKVTNPSNTGDAQYVAQPYDGATGNLERYSLNKDQIKSHENMVTFWMNWQGENEEVLFATQLGDHRSTTMPASPDVAWTMANTNYSPSIGSAKLHINLWVDGGPVSGGEKTVVVKYLAIPGKTSDDSPN